MSLFNIREAHIDDLPRIVNVFEHSVKAISSEHYDDDQITAWLQGVNHRERWLGKIISQFFIVAVQGNDIVGFGSLEGDYLDFMYVHPEFQKNGVGGELLGLIIGKAREQGEKQIKSMVSKVARTFFEHRGFEVDAVNKVVIGDIELRNYRMLLKL